MIGKSSQWEESSGYKIKEAIQECQKLRKTIS